MRQFITTFTALVLFMGCGEKLADKAIILGSSKESVAFKEPTGKVPAQVKLPEIASPLETPPQVFAPESPLFGYPVSGYARRGGGGGKKTSNCSRIEGDVCNTREPSPFNEGKIVCESGQTICKPNVTELLYYLYIEDFIKSFIEIPTSNVLVDSSTISSKYLAGRAPVYNAINEKAGTCSASFLCMQNQDGIYTDISNYLSVDIGLIVTWFTPTTLINLELDSIVHSMVTECLVVASTKVGVNPLYGEEFNMIVSSDDEKIYFELTRIAKPQP